MSMEWLKEEDLLEATSIIKQEFALGKAVRIGEASVVSTKIHAVRPDIPGTVFVFPLVDAGEILYNLVKKSEIVHIDVFHEIAKLNPKIVAHSVLEELNKYKLWVSYSDLLFQVEYIDVQTAEGGGKLNGLLNYARTEALKRSHLNHVHLAIKLNRQCYALLFFLVSGVEKAILSQGLDLRKIERIEHLKVRTIGEEPPSAQTVFTDSKIFSSSLSNSSSLCESNWEYQKVEKYYDKLVELFEMTEDFQETEQILNFFLHPMGKYLAESSISEKFDDGNQIVRKMLNLGLIVNERNIYSLTAAGKSFTDWFYRFKGELELNLNKLNGKMRCPKLKVKRYNYSQFVNKKSKYFKNTKFVVSADSLGWINDLAAPETVTNIIKKYKLNGERDTVLDRREIMVYQKRNCQSIDVCLVLDGSASMAGKRIRAAKSFVRHISINSKNKIGIIVFQEDRVTKSLFFTRDRQSLKRFLNQIKARGLTPLAAGLREGLAMCQSSGINNPLLLLITDGRPTVSSWSSCPESEAIKIAKKVADAGIKFCCVGVEANKDFLEALTRKAKGVLYLVKNIEQNILADILVRESVK